MRATSETRALGWLALVALAIIAWLAQPFAISMLLGALMAFVIEPLYHRLARRSRRPTASAVVIVLATGALVLAAASGFITLFITKIGDFVTSIGEQLRSGDGFLTPSMNNITAWLAKHGVTVDVASMRSRLESGIGEIASRSASIAGAVAAGTFAALLGLFFALLAMFVVLRHWPQIALAIERVSPLHQRHTRAVLDEFRRAGRATLSGTVVTGLAQGLLAGIGYWIAGVPQPAFFGAATALASLVPGVGTLLVWVPAALFLFATGHAGHGLLLLIWCSATVIGVGDYVVRPALVGDEDTPAILTFVALFGGLEVLGIPGLIVGPILMSLAVATLRLYVRETADARRSSDSAQRHIG